MNTQILSVATTVTSSSGREAPSPQMGESGPDHTTASRLSVSFSDIFAGGASFGEQTGEDLPGPLVPTADDKVEQSEPGETPDVNGVHEEAQMQGDVLPVRAVAIETDEAEVSVVDEANRKPPTAPSALTGVMSSREPTQKAALVSMALVSTASEPAVPAQKDTAASSGVDNSRHERMEQTVTLARPYLPTTRAIGEGDGEIAPNRGSNGGGSADRTRPAQVPEAAIQSHDELRKVSQISNATTKADWAANLSEPKMSQTLAKAEAIFVGPSENNKPKTLVESRFSGLDIAPKSEVSKMLNVQERSIDSFGNLARIIQPS
ncbi:MAG: hypothetical protein VXW22_16540, partial [Pseudomonadota bacterium]|nr:hypothetical protein [Pseudomonadota bacterium]